MNKYKIAVISSVHETFDTRIYYKQIDTLRKRYDVTYYTPYDDQVPENWMVGLFKGQTKLGRLLTHLSLLLKLPASSFNLYLLHDPELLPLGIILKLFGKKVVWDMHEDTYNDIQTKNYLPSIVKIIFAFLYRLIQGMAFRFFDGFILAEDDYASYFNNANKFCIVHNYPLHSNLKKNRGGEKVRDTMVYLGSITTNRGIFQLLHLCYEVKKKITQIKLVLIGPFSEKGLYLRVIEIIKNLRIENNVEIRGPLKSIDAYPIVAKSMIGLALLLPEPNFTKSLPTKLFEYMALGLPVVVSNFPLWEDILNRYNAGVTVDPLKITDNAILITDLLMNPKSYEIKSLNARKAAQAYSWETEGKVMNNFLEKIMARNGIVLLLKNHKY